MAELGQYAYKLGYDLGNFESWYSSLDFVIRRNAGMKTVKESYYRGVEERAKRAKKLIVYAYLFKVQEILAKHIQQFILLKIQKS